MGFFSFLAGETRAPLPLRRTSGLVGTGPPGDEMKKERNHRVQRSLLVRPSGAPEGRPE